MATRDPSSQEAGLSFDDMRVGQRFVSGTYRIDQEQIREFAGAVRLQPFHLDPEAAKASLFGGLVASGLHTAAVTIRLAALFGESPVGVGDDVPGL